jgi:hypothetical protein
MAIDLDVPLVRQLIEARFGSVDAFAIEWEHRIETRKKRSGEARDRATIYRWLKQGMPSKRDELFGFAAVLDVDPIALLRLDADFVRRNFPRERLLFQIGSIARSKLHPFWEVFVPSPNWPSEELPRSFYGREWSKFHFRHDALDTINVFAGASIRSEQSEDFPCPRVFLFAYRRYGAVDTLWRPYGVVVHRNDCTRLISENGTYQELKHPTAISECFVETYYGLGAAEFQIASLHRFQASVAAPSNNSMAVRFPA